MKRFLGPVWHAWDAFWFEPRAESELAALGLFRIVFAGVMFFAYLSRVPDLGFFYTENGVLPSAYRAGVDFFRYRPTPLDFVDSLMLLHGLHAVLLFSLLCLALGIGTRFASVVAYALHLCFLNRNPAVLFGVDTIGTFFLLYLCFTPSGARYSLDARRRPRAPAQTTLGHIAYRLMQVQVCVIYGYSGLTKLQGSRWWNGAALWDVLAAGNLQRWDLSVVAHAPILLAILVYPLLLWEVYFPVLVWQPRLRRATLAFGVAMHIGIGLFLNLPSFGMLMIALYILFLREHEVEGIVVWLARMRGTWGGNGTKCGRGPT